MCDQVIYPFILTQFGIQQRMIEPRVFNARISGFLTGQTFSAISCKETIRAMNALSFCGLELLYYHCQDSHICDSSSEQNLERQYSRTSAPGERHTGLLRKMYLREFSPETGTNESGLHYSSACNENHVVR